MSSENQEEVVPKQTVESSKNKTSNEEDVFVIDHLGTTSDSTDSCKKNETSPKFDSSGNPLNDDDLFIIDHINSKTETKDARKETGSCITVDPVQHISSSGDLFMIDPIGTKTDTADVQNECEEAKADFSKIDEKTTEPSLDVVDGLFRLDTTPEISKERPLGPRYRREFDKALKTENIEVTEVKVVGKADGKCFNCLGDHSVSNCPHPRNQQEISKNRKAFLISQGKDKQSQTRYHIEKKNKYSHLKPGVVSENLRDAMGLRSRDIPLFIYQMRIHGYPPGWVEEMKEDFTEISIIDSATVVASDVMSSPHPKSSFDVNKIIDYPGFNVPAGPHYRDDWQYLNFPPMMPVHAKECFAQQLMHCNFMNNRTELCSPPLAEPPSVADQEPIDMEESSVDSIEELESRRKALLAELEGSDDKDVRAPGEEETKDDNTSQGKSQLESDWKSLKSPSHGHCKQQEMGTPVSIRFSPYNILPNREKFSRDMGEMIPFENLPNSTGTFQKMRSLLEKVRNIFKKK